jgi:syntaxin 1A
MPRDRLAALKACQDHQSQDDSSSMSIEMHDLNHVRESTSVEEFYKECEDLISSIDRLGENVDDVKKTHSLILSTPQVDDSVKRHLENVMAAISSEATRIKLKLKQMGQVNEHIGKQDQLSAEHRIRDTQHQMLTRKFIEVITDYQLTQADYRDRCKARIQRQLEITGRVTTDDEIEEMIESGNPAIFTQGIEMETQQAKQTLAEIEARHSDIMKLEKSIMELRDLFVDLATLVETQGEMVNRIENHVALSKSHVDKARVEVNQAIAYRSKARIKKIICLTILIFIIAGIVLTVIYA